MAERRSGQGSTTPTIELLAVVQRISSLEKEVERLHSVEGVSANPLFETVHIQKTSSTATAHPNTVLTIEDDDDAIISLLSLASGWGGIYFGSPADNTRATILYNHADDLLYINAPDGDVVIQPTGGPVGIGTSEAGAGDGSVDVEIANSSAITALSINTYDNDAAESRLYLRKSDTDTIGQLAQTDDGDWLGVIGFQGVDTGLGWAYGVLVYAIQRGAAGAAFIEADLIFQTYSAAGANTNQLVLDGGTGYVGIGTIPNSLMEWNFITENLEFVNAGSAGATRQDWIEVEVGGNQGFLHVFAAA